MSEIYKFLEKNKKLFKYSGLIFIFFPVVWITYRIIEIFGWFVVPCFFLYIIGIILYTLGTIGSKFDKIKKNVTG